MRPSKARRRFHTARVIRNRQRRARAYYGGGGWGHFWFRDPLPAGKCDAVDPYFGCGRPRCHICHSEKLEPRRAREWRSWQDWESEYL